MPALARGGVGVAAAAFLSPGAWAFFWPFSFHEHVAGFEPFNLHLLHDVGAFQIGIGVALVGALAWRDALSVALVGAGAGASAHAVSHVLDSHLGGRPSDPWTLSLLAILLVAALVMRRHAIHSNESGGRAGRIGATTMEQTPTRQVRGRQS